MKAIFTIAKKEIKTHLTSPSFYVITFLFLAMLSFLYFILLKNFAAQSMQQMIQTRGQGGGLNLHRSVMMGHISSVNLIFLFFIPVLTVKFFSEEKKTRTFDLLLTSPITATEIVVGKLLAALILVWGLVVLSTIYPLSTAKFAEIQWGVLGSAYLGLLLIASIYTGIGLFCSSLTDSMILAGFMSIILCLLTWFVSWGSGQVENPMIAKALEHISVASHFSQFAQGAVHVSSIIFSLSVIFFFGFLTQRVVESSRWR